MHVPMTRRPHVMPAPPGSKVLRWLLLVCIKVAATAVRNSDVQ
jgi:hypothetical protein